MKPTRIEKLLIMGDSLSDEGEMSQRKLFGLIPMNGLAGLKGKSPDGRFTNGYPWSDQVLVDLANEFTIKQLEREKEATTPLPLAVDALIDDVTRKSHPTRRSSIADLGTEISDELIEGDSSVKKRVEESYSLDMKLTRNNLRLTYEGQVLARSYAQGGLTAYDYAWSLSSSISRFFSRIILSTLSKKRKEVLTDDIALGTTLEEKGKTLVVEWSGANDLITVNKKPSEAEADKAIAARIKNIEELIKHGYKHFVLFNLPDLGLTPRYQRKGGDEKATATRVSEYFNIHLQAECDKLKEKYRDECSIEVFDVASTFKEVYDNPAKYGFDPAKQTTPYAGSKDFKINPDHTSPEEGYMFWDDVHPIMLLQSIMSNVFYKKYAFEYNFQQPRVIPLQEPDAATKSQTEKQLLEHFREFYQDELDADKLGCFGFFKRSRVPQTDDLAVAIQHALFKGGHRSFKVMRDLGWFDEKKRLIPDIPALVSALERAEALQLREVAPIQNMRP